MNSVRKISILSIRRSYLFSISCSRTHLNLRLFTTDSSKPLDTNGDVPASSNEKLGGFAKSLQKHSSPEVSDSQQKPRTFASLLRNSKFIDLGDPLGKIVQGTIYHTVNDDLYIDFGWKFHCVCLRPAKRGGEYVRGAKVRLRINDLEMSSRFLGSSKDLTLLEADCTLLGLVSSPAKQ